MQDKVMPNGKWVFDKQVADCFDDMLNRSIPDYSTMRACVFEIGKRFIHNDSAILDIGCSNGKSFEAFVDYADAHNGVEEMNITVDGYEISEPMANEAKSRFIGRDFVNIHNSDILDDFPDKKFDLVL